MHCRFFKDTHFVWLQALTVLANNLIDMFLINPNILYQDLPRDIYEY